MGAPTHGDFDLLSERIQTTRRVQQEQKAMLQQALDAKEVSAQQLVNEHALRCGFDQQFGEQDARHAAEMRAMERQLEALVEQQAAMAEDREVERRIHRSQMRRIAAIAHEPEHIPSAAPMHSSWPDCELAPQWRPAPSPSNVSAPAPALDPKTAGPSKLEPARANSEPPPNTVEPELQRCEWSGSRLEGYMRQPLSPLIRARAEPLPSGVC